MNEVVPLERNEVEWLRNLRAHVFSAESEVTALRAQYREAIAALRLWDAAYETNNSIAQDAAADAGRRVLFGV